MMNNFPKVTIILRGYNYKQVKTVMEILKELDKSKEYALEITLNSPDVFSTITKISEEYGDEFHIGAGTVLDLHDAKSAINAGAQFILSPIQLEKETLDYCKDKEILTVPAAMSPSEVARLWKNGASIIKIFPARTVGSKYFSDIQSPLGKLPLMAVGGISADNAMEYFENGASYVGIGSGIFTKEDILNQNKEGLKKSLSYFEKKVY